MEGLRMDSIIQYVTTHQFTVGVVAFVGLLIIYVVFKQLLKMALLLILLLLAMGGYMYFKDPGKMPANIQDALHTAKEKTGKVVETGKKVYGRGKAVAEKGVIYSEELREFVTEDKETKKKH
jgi:hypothetical protein